MRNAPAKTLTIKSIQFCIFFPIQPKGKYFYSDCTDLLFFIIDIYKTKELIVDFSRQQREHAPIYIDGAAVERINSFKFHGVHITGNLKWSIHTVW